MKKLTDDQSKIDLVSKLVAEGHIDFADAIKLLEVETEYLFAPPINQPYTNPIIFPNPIRIYPDSPTVPYIPTSPYSPTLPWYEINKVICGNIKTNIGDMNDTDTVSSGVFCHIPEGSVITNCFN